MPTSGSCAVIHPHEARTRKEAKPRELPQTSHQTASKTQPDRIRYQDRKVSPKVMGRGIPHTWLVSHNLLLPYNAALQYHFRLQEDGGPTSGKPRNGHRAKVHIHPSIHIGGIAHSIMAKFFGRSIHWSQLRRISCQARGLLKFTRRRKKAKEFSENELPETSAIYRAFDITSEVNIRVRMIFHIPVWLRKTLKKRVFSAKEGVYVYG
jgi:hypothetical protein